MVLKPSPAKPQKLTLSLIFVSLIIFFLAMIFCAKPHIIYIDRLQNQSPTYDDGFPRKIPMPRWLEFVVKETEHEKLKIAFVNMNKTAAVQENYGLHGIAEFIKVDFKAVDKNVEWKDFFPEWINESAPLTSSSQNCPEIPMPKFEDYKDLDVVMARIPCGLGSNSKGFKDIFRLQVNLVVANMLVKSGLTIIDDALRDVYLVVIGYCGPMLEIFRCDDLVWHERNVRIYRPNLTRLKQKVLMPVGSCHLAPPFAEPGQERWRTNTEDDQPREAYVTVLHSSEAYVCGAIALAQSIIQSGSTKHLVLLADETISKKSLAGLREAGWKIKPIKPIRSPHAQRNAYNKWNYSKLRIWQLTEYDKVIFIDADIILVKNIDDFFIYPQLSAAGNTRHVFNSGVMLIEPSNCTFKILMKERFSIISYNAGGEQGYLNQVFSWWHRWPSKLNFLKSFFNAQDLKHEIPQDLYAIHYLGIKPWMCYQDYDCNWDVSEFRRFASDMAHEKWWQVYKTMSISLRSYCALTPEMDTRIKNAREISRKASSPDGHWKIQVQDPRSNLRIFFPFWM